MKTKPYRRRLILVTACFAIAMPSAMAQSYRNLQGDAKASGVIKAQVEEYLNSFTPEPEPSGDTAAQRDH